MSTCECIYSDDAHPACQRAAPTHLIDLGGGGRVTAAMCDWCATDWKRRHPEIIAMRIDQEALR